MAVKAGFMISSSVVPGPTLPARLDGGIKDFEGCRVSKIQVLPFLLRRFHGAQGTTCKSNSARNCPSELINFEKMKIFESTKIIEEHCKTISSCCAHTAPSMFK